MEDMREAGVVASCAHTPSSPGFTAINQCAPPPSSFSRDVAVSQGQSVPGHLPCAGKSNRRNPAIASYLGLGGSNEPAHLVMYAPTPDGQPTKPQSARKHRSARNDEKLSSRKKRTTSDKVASRQRRVSETLRATKPSTKSGAHRVNESTDKHLSTPIATAPYAQIRQTSYQEHVLDSASKDSEPVPQSEAFTVNSTCPDGDDDDDFGQLCFDFDVHTCDAINSLHSTHDPEQIDLSPAQFNDGDFDDDLMDEDLLGLTSDLSNDLSIPQRQSTITAERPVVLDSMKHTLMSDTPATTGVAANAGGSSLSSIPKKFMSPVTLTTRLLAVNGDEARKPIVRPAFPAAVRDRSPIIGLSASTLLRSCFRVGEAISQSYHAAKAGNQIVIELYARILDSERDEMRQRFTFCDLFHARPPYIQATYAAAIWKTVQLFEYDSARLMQQGRLCRCIGTMKRNGKDWVMTVLNIWEATWDDVEWVEGIVNF